MRSNRAMSDRNAVEEMVVHFGCHRHGARNNSKIQIARDARPPRARAREIDTRWLRLPNPIYREYIFTCTAPLHARYFSRFSADRRGMKNAHTWSMRGRYTTPTSVISSSTSAFGFRNSAFVPPSPSETNHNKIRRLASLKVMLLSWILLCSPLPSPPRKRQSYLENFRLCFAVAKRLFSFNLCGRGTILGENFPRIWNSSTLRLAATKFPGVGLQIAEDTITRMKYDDSRRHLNARHFFFCNNKCIVII